MSLNARLSISIITLTASCSVYARSCLTIRSSGCSTYRSREGKCASSLLHKGLSSTISSSRAASRNTSRSYFVTPISFFFFNREPYPNRAYRSFATSQLVRMLQVRKERFSLTAPYYIKYICTGERKTELYIKRVRVHILDN